MVEQVGTGGMAHLTHGMVTSAGTAPLTDAGRAFEVTADGTIVWEYMYPLFGGGGGSNAVYRGYRLPYDWIPQLERPNEQAVVPPDLGDFRVP